MACRAIVGVCDTAYAASSAAALLMLLLMLSNRIYRVRLGAVCQIGRWILFNLLLRHRALSVPRSWQGLLGMCRRLPRRRSREGSPGSLQRLRCHRGTAGAPVAFRAAASFDPVLAAQLVDQAALTSLLLLSSLMLLLTPWSW